VIFTASKTPQHVVKITTYAFLSALALRCQWPPTLQALLLVLQIGVLMLEHLLHFPVAHVEFLLGLLELGLLLGNLLLEHHLHLCLHLCELGLMQRALFCQLRRRAVDK